MKQVSNRILINYCRITICVFFLLLFPIYLNAQSASIKQHENCGGTVGGIIEVVLPQEPGYVASITPSKAGSKSGNIVTFSGLKAGDYVVKIAAEICLDKPLFTTSLTIKSIDECTFPVSISVISQWSCNNPAVVLKATPEGGTPPYTYSWGGETLTVSQTGEVSVTVRVTDSDTVEKRVGYGETVLYIAPVQCSFDPNEITGPTGYAEQQMIAKTGKMDYTIFYENSPDFATAPATRVRITYPVSNKQNVNSFRLSDFGFGSFVFTVPQNTTNYYKRLDLEDSLGVWLDVTAGMDIVKRELFWIFQSIDPQTGVEPVDAQMGYLPVNNPDIHNGEGYVNFSILPSQTTATGDTVLAQATIVFDDNAPIETNLWSNIIDAGAPVSSLTGSYVNDSTVAIVFSGQDDLKGSGIKHYKLYVSVNEEAYTLYNSYLPDSTCVFSVKHSTKYKFFSIAEDNVGNVEQMKNVPEFETGELNYTISTGCSPVEGGIAMGSGTYNHGSLVTLGANANNGYVFSHWTKNNELVQRDSVISFVAGESAVLVAHFLPEYEISIDVNPVNAGNVIGDTTYLYGDTARVKALPGMGYRFVSWTRSGEFISRNDGHNFAVYNNTHLTANFEPQNYDVLIYSVTGGSIKGDTSAIYNYSDTICVIAVPQSCYDFVDWTVNGTSITGDTLNMIVTEHLDIRANYALKVHDVYIAVEPLAGGIISGNSAGTYNCGDTLSMFARATACYNFKHWTRNNAIISTTENYEPVISGKDTIIAHFELKPYPVQQFAASICQGETYDFFKRTLTTSGVYRDTLQTVNGCDSIVQLTLTVNQVATTPIAASICQGSSYRFGGKDLTAAGTYRDTLQSVHGCDSVVVLTLKVNPVYSTPIAASICQGDSYRFDGKDLTVAGVYRDTLQSIHDCDSIVVLTLKVNPVYSTPIAASICQGSSYRFDGKDLTIAGTYRDTLQSIHGCDSVVVLTLKVNPVYSTPIAASICQGDSYRFGGKDLTATGTYRDTLQSVHGCDSVVVLTLKVNPVYSTPIAASICQGDSYRFDGKDLTIAGTYRDTLQSIHGCDSIVVLTLKVNPVYSTPIAASICQGDSYRFGGKDLTAAGVYRDTLLSVHGCDSVVVLTLKVNQVYSIPITASICQGNSYRFGGKDLTVAGTYRDTLKSIYGCDSIVVLNLTISPDPIVDLGGNRNLSWDETVTLDAGDGFKSYEWSTGANTQTITVENTGDDMISIWVQVSSADNCLGSDTIQIVYQESVDVDKSLTISNESIKVFPNPTSGKINILFDRSEWREVALYDMNGKEIYKKQHDGKEVVLDFSHLPNATYILKVDNQKQFKVIVVH